MIWNDDISFEGFTKKINAWYEGKESELCDPPIDAQFALDLIFKTLVDDKEDKDVIEGANIIATAIVAPVAQIAINAGVDPTKVVTTCRNRRAISKKSIGYDALTGEYKDMIAAGVIDPVKVTRSALQNASSISGVFLTTEAAIVTIKQ